MFFFSNGVAGLIAKELIKPTFWFESFLGSYLLMEPKWWHDAKYSFFQFLSLTNNPKIKK